MPRIRTIKPEFWTDEKLSVLDPTTRLVFLGLVSLSDDAGRIIDNVKTLDGLLFSSTDDSCRAALETLAALGRIVRYRAANGQSIIQVVHWTRHQKVDRPSAYVLPGMDAGDDVEVIAALLDTGEEQHEAMNPRETLARVSRDTRAPTVDRGPGIMDHGPTTEERIRPVDRSANDSIAGLLATFEFGPFADAVAGICHGARNPEGVARVLRQHLAAENGYEPGSPAEVGNACLQYTANGAAFNAAFFAGFLRRAKRNAERAANRHRNTGEARSIAAERRHRETASCEEAAAERAVAAFKNAHPGEYADLVACAEAAVPTSITLGRDIIVGAQVLQMIRREAT